MIGILEIFSGLGFAAGPPIGGALYSLGGFQLPFTVLGSLLIIAGLLSIPLIPPQDGLCSNWFLRNKREVVFNSRIWKYFKNLLIFANFLLTVGLGGERGGDPLLNINSNYYNIE